jgi:hypothetical protein
LVLCTVLIVVGYVHARGMFGWPGLVNYDEGVYMQQAWSVAYEHRMMPGTYTYDHPYGDWTQIAAVIRPTGLLFHNATAVAAGRQVMLLQHLVSSVFLYLLARRMKLLEPFAGLAVLLFSLSPLALMYQRLVFIDNGALMWLIIAYWCLMSPGRSAAAAKWAGLALGFSFMCKETFTIPGLMLAVALFDYRKQGVRFARALCFFAYAGGTVVILWGVYALAKSELIPGKGHVSLIGTVEYQLVHRAGTGSLLDPSSGTYHAAMGWLHQDPVILGGGLAAAIACLLMKRVRAVALALLIQVAMMCRNGYLPYAYATALFPFAALCLAAVADRVWGGVFALGKRRKHRWLRLAIQGTLRPAYMLVAAAACLVLAYGWQPQLAVAMDAKPNIASELAANYLESHASKEAKIVTNDDTFTDLAIRGFHPISEFKPDNDPAVAAELPQGWRSINYLVLGPNDTVANLRSLGLRIVAEARVHAVKVKSFQGGDLVLWKVVVPSNSS